MTAQGLNKDNGSTMEVNLTLYEVPFKKIACNDTCAGSDNGEMFLMSRTVTAGVITGITCTSILLILTIVAFIVMR